MTDQNPAIAANVAITLNAVLAAIDDEAPKVLCVGPRDALALPYGPFDPERHRTFEIGVREWVTRQTHLSLGYIEQLYTFGDRGREAPLAAISDSPGDERVVSVGYLALAPSPAPVEAMGAGWRDWYWFFPWEDWRNGEPQIIRERIIPALSEWARRCTEKTDQRNARIAAAFGLDNAGWDDARTLDRYELMYEAGLAAEALRDRGAAVPQEDTALGAPMKSDHRRILATAVGRLRGKLRYRPIIFKMTPPSFTLLHLQRTAEAIVGFQFHKQNFRRSVENSGLIERTNETTQQAGGRPAALFRAKVVNQRDHHAVGLTIPSPRA